MTTRAKTGRRRRRPGDEAGGEEATQEDTQYPLQPNNPNFPDQEPQKSQRREKAGEQKKSTGDDARDKHRDQDRDKEKDGDEDHVSKEMAEVEEKVETPRKPIAEMTESEKIKEGTELSRLACLVWRRSSNPEAHALDPPAVKR